MLPYDPHADRPSPSLSSTAIASWASSLRPISSGPAAPRRRRGPADRSVAQTLQRPLGLSLGVALGDRAALVIGTLPLRHRQLDLGPSVLEVDAQRNQCHALLTAGAAQ